MLLSRMSRVTIILMVVCCGGFLSGAAAEPIPTPLTAPLTGTGGTTSLAPTTGAASIPRPIAPKPPEPQDVLVYPDGDRIQGRLVERNDRMIVFESNRFGVLRVPTHEATVILPDQTALPNPVAAEGATGMDRFSPALLAARLGNFFGPWHGRFAFMTEVVTDTTERNGFALESLLQRKWRTDEVQLKLRYDYSSTNAKVTTDVAKADGLWRHDFSRRYFALYRPSVEWNRASYLNDVPNDYVQLQQEVGVGVSAVNHLDRKLRVGASGNLFSNWGTTPDGVYTSRTVASSFLEAEFKLPWRMYLLERGAYYLPSASATDGWENRVELSKKFTETLSTSIRHDIRRYNPDGKTQDYTRLRLLFGVDF
jgi:Protein of unknown function, DUF481